MRKILIVNPYGIGDVLFATPLVANLRRAFPDAFLGFMANRRSSAFLAHNPKINQVFVYERDEFAAASRQSPWAGMKKWLDFRREVRACGFDTVYDLSLNQGIGFFLMACGIPQRIGFDYRGRGSFMTHKVSLKGFTDHHVVEYFLQLLAMDGVPVTSRRPEIPVSAVDEAWAKAWLARNRLDGHSWVALIPGGGASWGGQASSRRWSPESYALLVDKIVEKTHSPVILLGDVNDVERCRKIAQIASGRVLSLAGETTVTQMAALVSRSLVTVANDGGPLHVAAAAGARTVSIFGPVSPLVYGAYPPQGHAAAMKGLACQPCYRNFRMTDCQHVSCLATLTPEEVYQSIERILA